MSAMDATDYMNKEYSQDQDSKSQRDRMPHPGIDDYADFPISIAWIEGILKDDDSFQSNSLGVWASYRDLICDPERTVYGASSEFHNAAASFARKDLELWAFDVVMRGLLLYPTDPDLLADALKYGSVSGKREDCEKIYRIISSTAKHLWSWRSFVFTIDYLKDSLQWTKSSDEFERVYREALNLSIEFQKTLTSEERGYVAEAEVHLIKADESAAMTALETGIRNVRVAPQCCLKYSDLLLKSGQYKLVIDVAAQGIRATAQEQPTTNTGYFFYVSGLARDALIHQEARDFPSDDERGFGNRKLIAMALSDYAIANGLFGRSRSTYSRTIWQRREILLAKSGWAPEKEDPTSVEDIIGQMLSKHASDEE